MTDFDAKPQKMAMKGRAQPHPSLSQQTLKSGPSLPALDGAGDAASLHMSWQQISHKLKVDLGEAKWKAWIKPLVFEAVEDGVLIVRADSSFLRDRVLSNYAEKLRMLAQIAFADVQAVDVVLNTSERGQQPSGLSGPAADFPPRITS
ncbi:MAG: DnaA N-terminal domain-containing protein, partial [Pseudomonadota bacterium]|nr:DnaA N-terminal domain-containing protein [Pseudomonadota bacterium]